jgi:hypothetical protein
MLCALIVTVILGQNPGPGGSVAPSRAEARAAGPSQSTPEDAFRSFFLAVLTHDEPALRKLIVRNDQVVVSDEDFAYLLIGERPPLLARVMVQRQIPLMKVKRLQPGDQFELPGGQVIAIAPEEVSDTRAVVLEEDGPVPTRCWKVDGSWRVDPRSVIAGRKAAEAAQKRAEAQQAEEATPTGKP